MRSFLNILTVVSLASTLCLSLCSIGWSQEEDGGRRDRGGDRGGRFSRGGGGPGGPGGGRRGGGGGLLGEVQNEGTRSEINLTEEQLEKLNEIGQSMGNRDQFGDIFSRMQSAESEEERTKIREEIRTKMEETRTQAEEKMKSVLSEDQFKRLDQIRLHRDGSRALGRDEIQSELGVTDEQKQKLEALQAEQFEKYRELGFGSSAEDREKVRQEFEEKTMSILTEDQKSKWQKKLGPPPADAGQPRSVTGGRPGMEAGGAPREVRVEEVPEGAETTLSFGNNGASSSTEGDSKDRGPAKLSFNFRYAPWTEVLRLFARESGLSLDLIDVPPGTFSYFDQKSYTSEEALDVLNGYLLPKGFVLVHRDDFLVSLNIDNPIPPNLIPKVKPEDLPNRGKNELLTVTFPIEAVDAAQVASEINELKGPQGKVVALPSSNSVLVTDIGSNLLDINTMLNEMIGRPGPNDMSFKPYQIENLPVIEAEAILRSVLGIGSGVANVSAMYDSRSRSQPNSNSTITIASDERTNKLLVSTTSKTHQLIEEALKTIDVEGEASNFSAAANKPFLRVYSVTSADAREVVKTIDALMPGIVVNEDGRNGKIHIMASPDKHSEVDNLIRQMDGMGTSSQQMSVIPLSKMDPMLAAATVRAMFLKDGELAPTVEADIYGRQLMIRGDANQLAQIKLLLGQLGEDGTGQRDSSSESRIRTFPLSGRDPEEILPLIQRMWNQRSGSSIRIVNPEDRGPVRDVISPSDGSSVRDQQPASTAPASTQREPAKTQRESVQNQQNERLKSFPLRTASQTTVISQEPETASSEDPAPKTAPPIQQSNPLEFSDDELLNLLDSYIDRTDPQEPSTTSVPNTPRPVAPPANQSSGGNQSFPADVNITVMGDDLMLYSSDPEVLNQLEELLESAMQAIPPSTSWTVFTLQSADATEVSLMLEQLLPYSNVSSASSGGGMLGSLTGAASSLGSGIAEMTGLSSIASAGQSLRIIPDTRLNSLFVSGPSSQVKEVEEMLRVLDSSEWPDTLRDKVSRLISLEYADADDVLRMVKESYKVYIDPPQQQNARNNPLAAMMGGGGRGGKADSAEAQIKMTASVDSNTNQLIIWADDGLFQEVKSFVESVDESARQARRTVRVVSLRNTNSSTIKGALGTLMPKVNVSSTASRQGTPDANKSPNSNDNNSGRSQEEQERIRQFFEQRMKERAQGGGGDTGGRPSFGGGGRPGGGRPGGR